MAESNKVENVSVGKPKIGGAVFMAPLGSKLPTDAVTQLDQAFKCLGYCSEDGLVNANKVNTEKVKAWGGDTVVNTATEKEDTFKTKLIESLNEEVIKTVYGKNNVEGSLTAGLTIKVNSTQAEDFIFVVEMILKGGYVKRIVVPIASISELGDITYKDNEPIGYDLTLLALPDASGNTHYEYMKKGV